MQDPSFDPLDAGWRHRTTKHEVLKVSLILFPYKQILFHKSFQHCFLVLPGSPCSHRYGSSLSCSCLSPGSLSFSFHCVPDRSTSYWYMFITQALTPSVPWRLAPSLLKLFSSLTEAPPLSSPLLRTVPLPFFYSSSNTRSGIHKQPPNGFPTNVLS